MPYLTDTALTDMQKRKGAHIMSFLLGAKILKECIGYLFKKKK